MRVLRSFFQSKLNRFLTIFRITNSKIIKEYIPEWSIADEKLEKSLEAHLSDYYNGDIDVIILSLYDMARMNNDYRGVEGATDVLSFGYEQHDSPSEVYLSPEYISKSYSGAEAVAEVLRCLVHGVLHLSGFKHEGYFEEGAKEEMFVKQEEVLAKIKSDLEIK